MHRRILVAPLLLGLGACAQVGQQVSWDATTATTMATNWEKIDPAAAQRVPCYTAFQTLGGGIASTQPPAGAPPVAILTTAEGVIELQSAMQIPACQAIIAQILLLIAQKAPIGGGLIP
jgi:hypothetical protein